MKNTARTVGMTAAGVLALLYGTAHAVSTFGPNASLATPQRPAGMVIADFNNDGNRDLAVATDAQDKITVCLGIGAGGFNGPINTQIGSSTGLDTMVAVDFGGNGTRDLVVVLQNQNLVRGYLGNGNGTFTAGSTQAAIGSNARSLIAADFTNDGQLHYATANRDTNNVTIIMRSGNNLVSSSLASGAEPRSVAAADINADGRLDLTVSCHDDRTMRTYLGNGNGTFTPAQVFRGRQQPLRRRRLRRPHQRRPSRHRHRHLRLPQRHSRLPQSSRHLQRLPDLQHRRAQPQPCCRPRL